MAAEQRISDHIEAQAARWVVERDGGLTKEDERALRAWLAADPQHRQAFEAAERTWAAMASAPVKAEINRRRIRSAWSETGDRPRSRQWVVPALAASLAIISLGAAMDWPMRLRADAMTATGERRDVTLDDGSIVQLNTASAIAVDYSGTRRIVRLLRGEAAFTVAADRARPFSVEAGDGTTTALGTRFIVRREGAETEVTVTEHRVRLFLAGVKSGRIDLSEGQSTRYGPSGITRPHKADIEAATSWMRGRLEFVDQPLGELVAELNRYYPGYFGVLDEALAARRVSGVFRTDDPVAALDTLQSLLDIGSIRLTDRLILLHS